MKRIQLFELEDQAWFPRRIRDYMTDFLRTVAEKFDLFGPSVPLLAKQLRNCGTLQIVDLASGGGGQWRTLIPELLADAPGLRLVLTDRFPNRDALSHVQQAFPEIVRIEQEAVDARSVPQDLDGVRTMFLSLHHFCPEDAVAILQDAVESQAGIVVLEAQQRDLGHVIRFALSPIFVLLLTPLIRPWSVGRIFFTYVVPIVPIAVGWDGVVSVLRTYSLEEMAELASRADPGSSFAWSTERLRKGPQIIQVLTGTPVSEREHH